MVSRGLNNLEVTVFLDDFLDLDFLEDQKLDGVITTFYQIVRGISDKRALVLIKDDVITSSAGFNFKVFYDKLSTGSDADRRVMYFDISEEAKTAFDKLRFYLNISSDNLLFRRVLKFWTETRAMIKDGYGIALLDLKNIDYKSFDKELF